MRTFALFVLAAFVPACGGEGINNNPPQDQPDMTMPPAPDMAQQPPDMTAPFPAPFPAPPNVVSGGGPLLKSPNFIPVYFSNDDQNLTAQVTDFLSKVGATNYWKATTSEYGVGPGKALMPVQLTETATGTISDAMIQTWLAGKLNANDPAFPVPDHNSLFVLIYPTGVTITLPQGGGSAQSCQSFGGYHSDLILDQAHKSLKVAYAVIPRCDNFGGLTGIDGVTATTSHEIIEASTDPYPQETPAFGQVDDDHIYWEFTLGGGETGDMCAQFPSSFTTFAELPYVVQRSWSNDAANAGTDPCQPALDNEVYFNAAPELNDQIMFGFGGLMAPGVSVPVGTSKTINLDLFSDKPTSGEWQVKAMDVNNLFGGNATNFSFALDRPTGRNGDILKLTITSNKQTNRGRGTFVVVSKLGATTNYWFGLIGQ